LEIYYAAIALGIGLILLAAALFFGLRSRKHIAKAVKHALKRIAGVDEQYLDMMKLPVMVLGENYEVAWYNDVLKQAFGLEQDFYGQASDKFLCGQSVVKIITSAGTNVKYKGRQYTVYGNAVKGGAVLYFIDDTEYKKAEEEYRFSLPTVAMIVLDNREDFISDNEDESLQIFGMVEAALQSWAAEYHALYKRITGSRYMVVFQERDVYNLVDTKFKILDKIREIKFNGRAATISVGVGRGCPDIAESEQNARRALDMALGRGGDQVAVVENEKYVFFGGVERAVEKRSRVKTRVIAETLQKAIEQSDRVILMGHKFSDFDCLGACIGLYGAVNKTFHKPCGIIADPERSLARPLIEKYSLECGKGVFVNESAVFPEITPRTLLIIVDTHSPGFLESENVYKKCKNIVVIDHHRKVVNYIKNALVFYHEPYCSSASEMVTELLSYIADKTVEKPEADALLCGIMLDTKNFVIKTGVRTFEAATYLKQKGADTVDAKALFADDMETYKQKFRLASVAENYNGCAITVCETPMKNARVIAAQTADSLLSLAGINASFVVFVTEDKMVNISARSYGKMNVQVLMEALGGGGHQSMAAAQFTDLNPMQAKEKLLEVIAGSLVK
jgi:c-di-AMP phosphodiesterase-like protein